MKLSIIGCGRWGSFLAWYLSEKKGFSVLMQGRTGSASLTELATTHKNEYVTLNENVTFTDSLAEALDFSDSVIISIGAQGLPTLAGDIKNVLEDKYAENYSVELQKKTFILCMKGLLEGTGKRLSEELKDTLGENTNCIAWVGPGHPQDFCNGIPNCMLLASESTELAKRYTELLSSDLIRLYYSGDMIGCEIGAAAKNVIGIAAGILDGMGLSSLKGALIARGPREIARLATHMGGDERSVFGLSHIGDYEATLFSKQSHNRMYGEEVAKGGSYDKLAEGYYTVRSLMTLSEKTGVELPICSVVNDVVHNGRAPEEAVEVLFARSIKQEF